jgi:predicted ATP-dependent endonuclease of OLD family
MEKKFTLIKDYYDEGYNLYKKKTVTLNSGVTVLVGCNGIGKTTFLNQIEHSLEKDNIPCIKFNNLEEGGSDSLSKAIYNGDIEFFASGVQSSEGEHIVLNMTKFAERLSKFVKEGKDPKEDNFDKLRKMFTDKEKDTKNIELPKERWILLDAVDSGLSVDNVIEIKDLFDTILKYNFGNEIYILISANEYEMARNGQCFDVYNGKYVQFKSYDDYREFILKSRNIKDKRYNDYQNKIEKSNKR